MPGKRLLLANWLAAVAALTGYLVFLVLLTACIALAVCSPLIVIVWLIVNAVSS